MKIRSFEEIHNDLMNINFEPVKENVITGEEYEDWVKARFGNLTGEEENNE